MQTIKDDILSYREMCDLEKVQVLQRGMNFRLNPAYSVILMSQRSNAPYEDKIHQDGLTIEYEGHDTPRRSSSHDPKSENQVDRLPSGRPTQNGLFIESIKRYKLRNKAPEIVKVYEKIMPGVWSLKGFFELTGYKVVLAGSREVFRFMLKLIDGKINIDSHSKTTLEHNRVIPTEVKKQVWARDKGRCVKCGSIKNLHFDHELPYSKGGTSISPKNIRLLCMKHNLEKSSKIE